MTKQEAKQQIAKLIEKYQRLVDTRKVKSYNEAQTRNEFIEPLFEFLGWDMRNLENPNEVTTEETVSKGRVDLAFRLNHIPVMFLEAKALKVDLDEWKWAEQAINYSWNKSVTWAILSDFEGIKVFNAEIPPKSLSQNLFFELKWHEYLDRFDQLWLLSKESFEEKKLAEQAEKWGKLTKRKQVGEKLFEDLTTWRALLTKDFKKNNSTIDEDALDEGVQKVLDRLIFIRTAEDRKIEQNILLSLVREWETAGKKHNIFKRLNDGFRWFDDHYNSKLFASHALENWKADDKVFETIIKGLYQTADGYRYDFSAISTDVLGGIYEQYLGYVQEKKEKDEKKKSKRKSQGIYYTPKYIVEYLIEQTLGEVLKKAKAKDIPNIKIIDPACGSGSFLISAYDKMLEAKTKLDKQTGLFDRFEILKNNIYGVDLDEQAIEIAQLNLLLRVLSQRTKLPTLSHNLKVGNSLVTGNVDELKKYFGETYREQRPFNYNEEFKEVFDGNGFDVVIGNPPWVSLKGKHKSLNFSEEELKYFYEKLNANTYAPNLYEMFIWRGLSLLKEGGYFSFIVPDRLCANRQFIKLREHILKNYTLKSLWFNVDFPGIIADTVIFVIQNKKPRANKIKVVEYPNNKFEKVPQSLYLSQEDFSFFYVPEIILGVFEKIKSNPQVQTLDQFVKTTSGCGAKSSLLHESKENEAEIKVMKGVNICRYGNKGYYWFEFKDENLSGRTRDEKKLSVQNKILLRKTGIDLIATFNDSGIYPEQSLYFAYDSDKETLLYLLAILNSKLMNTYYQNFAITNRDSTPQLKNVDLDKFPIVKPTDEQKMEIAKLAHLMLDLQSEALKTTESTDKHNRLKTEIEKLDEKIDRAIYKLYDLTDEEIATIEKNEAK